MATLRCKTPDMIEKEIWVYLFAHNLVRITMAQAAYLSDILPRQLSFKHGLQLWRIWRQQVTDFDDNNSIGNTLVVNSGKYGRSSSWAGGAKSHKTMGKILPNTDQTKSRN